MGSPETCPVCEDFAAACRHPAHYATPPAPADDARPMVTGGGLIKFDRRAADASGAEAMREACAKACRDRSRSLYDGKQMAAGLEAAKCADMIDALPIPARDDAVEDATVREAFVAHMATVGVIDVAWTNAVGPVGTRADHYGVMLSVEWEWFDAGYRAALVADSHAHTSGPAAPATDRPEVVCLCGSTRFIDTFQEQYGRLTDEGKIVLSVGRVVPQSEQALGSQRKVALDALHLRKIDLADRVLVLNVGGYVGPSTRREIEYAKAHGKPIDMLYPDAGLDGPAPVAAQIRALPLPPATVDAVERARRWATDAVIRALNAVGVRESNADDFAEIVGSSVDAAEASAGRDTGAEGEKGGDHA